MCAGWLALLAMAAAPPGRAPLRLQLDRCPDVDQATVSRVVTLELEAALADGTTEGSVTTAHAECGDARVLLTIDDPVTGKSTTRTLDLDGQPRGLRSRLLGLAISEAVLASWVELQLMEPPLAPPGASAGTATRREAADIAERHLQVSQRVAWPPPRDIVLGPEVRWFSSGLLALGLSGSAQRWLDQHPLAGVGLQFDGSYAERTVADLGHGTAISLALAPSLLMRSTFDEVHVTAGAGWLFGLALLTGEPASPLRTGRSALRGWTGPFVAVDVNLALWRSVFLRMALESGYALVPARGGVDGVQVVAFDGTWLGGALSLGTRL